RKSVTRKFNVKGAGDDGEALRVYAIVGKYDDGRPGEVFLKCDKQGTLISGAFDAVALSVSIGLQYGIPLGVYTDKLIGSRFEQIGRRQDRVWLWPANGKLSIRTSLAPRVELQGDLVVTFVCADDLKSKGGRVILEIEGFGDVDIRDVLCDVAGGLSKNTLI